MGRQVQPCGTEAAYRRHLDHGEPVCDECRQAHRDYDRARRPAPTRFDRPPCGTVRGYYSHRRHGETTCQECRDAVAADKRARYGKVTGTQSWRTPAPCGTQAAHGRHLRHGEEPCEACTEAHSRATAISARVARVVAAMAREAGA